MSEHTPGMLVQAGLESKDRHWMREIRSNTGKAIAFCGSFPDTRAHADARRIVACWNACEGITTERLEDLGKPLMAHLIGCDERAHRQVKEADSIRAVNAELMEALEEARRWIGDGDMGDGMAREIWTPKYAAAVDMVDAAIASAQKLKGEA